MKKKQLIAKLLLAMKITIVHMALSMVFTAALYANGSGAQGVLDKPVTISVENLTVRKVIAKVEKQIGVDFIYSSSFIDAGRKITCNVKEIKLKQFIEDYLIPLDIGYRILNDQVLLFTTSTNVMALVDRNKDIDQADVPVYSTITGTVTNEKGEPLEGATIIVKGTAIATTTNSKGFFRVEVPGDNTVLVITYTGFSKQEISVGKQNEFTIKLIPVDNELGDVVVIGYGSQRERKITGAISSINAKDFSGLAVTGVDQAIQGRMAGVQVTQNSGEPGGSISLRIRGVGSINSTNEPLYVVDGVPYGSLNAINPNDIERVDVLKDASAASIYGSRASNGVVLITTKRGKSGRSSVSVDAYAGIQNNYKKMDLLNGSQFAKLANENLTNGGFPANPAWSNPATVVNTDWQETVLQTAPIQSYNASISGGGDKVSTLFSIGYFDQKGIIVGSDYNRYTVRLNTDYSIAKNFKLGITLNGAFDEKKVVGSQNDFSGVLSLTNYMQPSSLNTTTQNGLFGLNPDGSIDPNGNTYFGWEGYSSTSKFAEVNQYPTALGNPLHTVKNYLRNSQKSQQLLAAAFAEYEIIPGLKIRSTFNYNFENSFNINSLRKAPTEVNLIGQYRTTSSYNENWNRSNQWNWINTVSYNKSFGQNNISFIAGMDALKNTFQFVNINTANAPDAQQVINASNNTGRVVSGYPTDFALISYFGRLTYDYADKYLLSASIRRDGSSKFGPNNKFGMFPSVSAGWRISEESFLQSSTFIDELKLRASYGTVGNQNIPNFKYLSTYSNDGGTYQYTLGSGQTPVNAIYADNNGDPDIRWEKSTQTNIGIDASFLKATFTLTADYYIKKLDDLLGNFPVPSYTGVNGGSILKNGFSMENKGIELSLGYNEHFGEVNFSANVNFSTLENKITKLTENEKGYVAQSISVGGGGINDGGAQTRTLLGERIGTFYGYITNGIIQNAADLAGSGLGGVKLGDRLFKDLNKDGTINSDDKTAIGNGLPKYIYGLSLRADYKGFDVSILLNGQSGVKIANMTRFRLYNMRFHNSTGIVNGSSDLLNSWTGPGTSNELPRNSYTAPTSNRWFSTFYIEDGSFVRIRNIQIGYTLPVTISKKAGMSRSRIYVAVQNLHTFTKYTGYDPEIGSPDQNVLTTGADFGRYPLPRMFTVGINCQF